MNYVNHDKIDLPSMFSYSNNIFIYFLHICIYIFIYVYIYINIWNIKDASGKNYKNNEREQEKSCERYQSLSKEEKEKKQQYGHVRYKNLLEDEKQKLVEYRKIISKWEKIFYFNYKKLFSFRKSKNILKTNDLESYFDEE